MTFDQGLIAAVVALSSVIVYLDRRQRAADAKNAALAERVGKVEGRQEGIDTLSKKTLALVHEAKRCNYQPDPDNKTT